MCLRKYCGVVLFIFTAICAAGQIQPADFQAIPGEREFSGRLIARPKDATKPHSNLAQLIGQQAVFLTQIQKVNLWVLQIPQGNLPAGEAERRIAEQLMQSGEFEYVLPDWRVFVIGTPNDPRFSEQWHHQMMQSPAAWDMHVGNPSVIVAVVDTGIVPHEDLPNRVAGYNAVTDLAEVDGGDLTDLHGHGTHVAGCAAAFGNNAIGVAGVGWNLSFMSIRASENGSAFESDLFKGAIWAAEHGAVSISVSFSGIGSQAHEDTGRAIHEMNATLLWAAGNSATNLSDWDLPSVLVVGASNSSDTRASFSSFGRGVDLFAPGVAILSTTKDGTYAAWSGTSMATPIANGAIGLIRSLNPALTAVQAEHVLLYSCDEWGGERNSEYWGFGRINLKRALELASTANVAQQPIANPETVKALIGESFQIDVLANDDNPNAAPLTIVACSASTSLGEQISILAGGGAQGQDVIQITGTPQSAAGVRTFFYVIEDPQTGWFSTTMSSVELLLPHPAVSMPDAVPGLVASYYAIPALDTLPNFDLRTPYASETVARVSISSTTGAFGGSGRSDFVGAVYTGFLQVPTTSIVTFALRSDEGSRLWIDDALVIDHDGLHASSTKIGSIALAQGPHACRVEYFERDGSCELSLRWYSSSDEIVPAPMFRRPCVDDCETAVSWGSDRLKQCGLIGAFQSVDARYGHTVGIGLDRLVRCVGNNSNGQCNVPTDLGLATHVACGDFHTVAVRVDGSVRCWGDNTYGQCDVPASIGTVTQVQAGWYHTIALQSDGIPIAWGWNDYDQCNVPADLDQVVQVEAGDVFSIARRIDGSLRLWGTNDAGEADFPANLSAVEQIAAGYSHLVALQSDHAVKAWGWNDYGQCDVPANLGACVQVAAGGMHSLALREDGSVVAWGYGGDGQTSVPADLGAVRQIVGGGSHSIALRGSPTEICIGDIDGSGTVDFSDVLLLLIDYGPCEGCTADVDHSGSIDFGDLLLVLLAFGPCS